MVNAGGTRHGTDVEENADVWLKDWTESVEEPSMGIDLFLILRFQHKNYLDWDKVVWVVTMG